MPQSLSDIITIMTGLVIFWLPSLTVLLAFFWNLFMLISSTGDAKKHEQARARLIWSIIAFFVFFSLIGIVMMLRVTLFGDNTYPLIDLGQPGKGTVIPP